MFWVAGGAVIGALEVVGGAADAADVSLVGAFSGRRATG